MHKVIIKFILLMLSIPMRAMEERETGYNQLNASKQETFNYLDSLPNEIREKIESYLRFKRFEELPAELREKIIKEIIKLLIRLNINELNKAKTDKSKILAIEEIVKDIKSLSKIKHFQDIMTNSEITKFIITVLTKNKLVSDSLIDACTQISAMIATPEAVAWARRNVAKDKLNEALFRAISWNDKVANVEFLINSGADVTVKNINDDTPLLLAVDVGCKEIVTLLLDKGADINATDTGGWTSLMISLHSSGKLGKCKHAEITKLLINRGSDINASDEAGNSALSMAIKSGQHPDIVTLLKDAKFKNNKT